MTPEPREVEHALYAAQRRYWRIIIAMLSCALALNAIVLGWFVQREFERTHRLETNAKILVITAESGIELKCFVDVYFRNPQPGATDESRRLSLIKCVDDRMKVVSKAQ